MSATGVIAAWGGPARAVDVLLRALGGAEVGLALPVAQDGTSVETRGMGLQPGLMEEIALGPALVRPSRAGVGREVVVGAESLRNALGMSADVCVVDVIGAAAKVRVGDRSFRIASVEAEYLGGAEYLYRLRLED